MTAKRIPMTARIQMRLKESTCDLTTIAAAMKSAKRNVRPNVLKLISWGLVEVRYVENRSNVNVPIYGRTE